MIELQNTSFSYSKSNSILDNLSLELELGHCYGLFGKNGAGKTTLLQMLCGGLTPNSGSVQVEEQSMLKRDHNSYSQVYLVPEIVLLPSVSISTFLKMNAPFYANFNEENFYSLIEQLDVPKKGKLSEMSQGQQKKAAIAFGIAVQTPWLLLDEPSNGLDIPSKQQFQSILAQNISQKQGIIISTHQIHDVETLIDHILILDNQKIILNSSNEELEKKFEFRASSALPEKEMLYHEKQGISFKSIHKNTSGSPSNIDLALLFNAAIANNNLINL